MVSPCIVSKQLLVDWRHPDGRSVLTTGMRSLPSSEQAGGERWAVMSHVCVLQDFTSARFVRLRLQKIRTLNADLMIFQQHRTRDVDPSVTRRVGDSLLARCLLCRCCMSKILTLTGPFTPSLPT